MVTQMPVEPNTLKQMVDLSSDNMIDLIETVGVASQFNTALNNSPENKVKAACIIITYANLMLEQCGFQVNIDIIDPKTQEGFSYRTNTNRMEEI